VHAMAGDMRAARRILRAELPKAQAEANLKLYEAL